MQIATCWQKKVYGNNRLKVNEKKIFEEFDMNVCETDLPAHGKTKEKTTTDQNKQDWVWREKTRRTKKRQ